MKKKEHSHWILGQKRRERRKHPISVKHKSIETIIRYDLETGKLQRWAKRKKLRLVDSTYERYRKEVLRKR